MGWIMARGGNVINPSKKNSEEQESLVTGSMGLQRESGFCFFVWCVLSNSRIFHSNGDVTITGKGLQI